MLSLNTICLIWFEVRNCILSCIQEHVSNSFCRSNEFRELCTADVIEYISDGDLKVENEDPVFEAVLMWVNEDRENR